jgi:hypothetical protein
VDGNLMPILCLLGPSGAGKSTLARLIAERLSFLHLEIDRYPAGDGIDLEGLRTEWDAFWGATRARELAVAINARIQAAGRRGAVLSFPSGVVFSHDHIVAAHALRIVTVVLYGTGAECLGEFLRREIESGRNLDADHWIRNNAASYAMFSRPEYAEYRLNVFDGGRFRDRATLLDELSARVR